MSKSKKPALLPRTDLHAISPLPIEFIVQRLTQFRKKGLLIEIADLHIDGTAFQISHPKMRSTITGTLRRWEGTHTRIDAITTLQEPPMWMEWLAHLVVVVFLFMWLAGCSLMVGFLSLFSFAGSVTLAIIFSLLLPVSKFFDKQRRQAAIDADRQMQLITLVLTRNLPDGTAPLVEFDGTAQSLERMLQRQRNQSSKP